MTLDAIGLEVMAHAFASIAEEMGAVLVSSALSPNVRERRDSSAALFDAHGQMIAQAAHIPVHLGAMPEAVAAVRALDPRPNDTFVLNDPFTGGTHLPDITMVHAIGLEDDIVGYAVVRAHHSDVGGTRPGSMPPHSSEVFQEGLIIPPVRWAIDGVLQDDVARLLLANVRTPDMRRGDLAAQFAACERGALRVRELVARQGRASVDAAVTDLLDYAERRARAALALHVQPGRYEAEDVLEGDGIREDDVRLHVAIDVSEHGLAVDFSGSDGAVPGNVNCPISVTRSAVLFVVRCLVGEDVPTNGGVQRVVTVHAPEGCVVNAPWPHAVAAGNVETSQRVADVLFLALANAADVPAQGQGTMNNVVLGGAGWTYYETLGGGQGATSRGPGPAGVHVGMSNTQNTPIEVLELEHPVRVRSYALRDSSGGAGRHRGGDGVVRQYVALDDVAVSVISERRRRGPLGVAGGEPGQPGRNSINERVLHGRVELNMRAEDVLTIETPGGGGWGPPLPSGDR
jgi:N-methylhydantoinase B